MTDSGDGVADETEHRHVRPSRCGTLEQSEVQLQSFRPMIASEYWSLDGAILDPKLWPVLTVPDDNGINRCSLACV